MLYISSLLCQEKNVNNLPIKKPSWSLGYIINGGGGGSRTRVSLVFTRGILLYLSHRTDLNLYPPYSAIKLCTFLDDF